MQVGLIDRDVEYECDLKLLGQYFSSILDVCSLLDVFCLLLVSFNRLHINRVLGCVDTVDVKGCLFHSFINGNELVELNFENVLFLGLCTF